MNNLRSSRTSFSWFLLFERLPWVSCRATPDIDAEKLRTPGNHGGNIIELTSWKCFSISLEDLEVSAYTAPNKHHHTPWICHSAAVQMCPASYRSVFLRRRNDVLSRRMNHPLMGYQLPLGHGEMPTILRDAMACHGQVVDHQANSGTMSAAVWRCAQVIAIPSRPFEGPALDVFFWQVAWQTPFFSWFEGIARGYTALLRLGTLSIGCCGRVSSMHFTRLCIAACKCWVT